MKVYLLIEHIYHCENEKTYHMKEVRAIFKSEEIAMQVKKNFFNLDLQIKEFEVISEDLKI